MNVRAERTNWRDEGISHRHRTWGYDCPAQDIDFLLMEYDKCKVVAIIEYKNTHAEGQTINKPQYKALIDLGNRANVPVFNVRYSDDYTNYVVTALNEKAVLILPNSHSNPPRTSMTELEYVKFLYFLRNRKIPNEILQHLEKG